VRALEAGAECCFMPADPDAVVKAVTAAVQSVRTDAPAHTRKAEFRRFWPAKERVGWAASGSVDLEGISDVVDAAESNEKAQEIGRPRGDAGCATGRP